MREISTFFIALSVCSRPSDNLLAGCDEKQCSISKIFIYKKKSVRPNISHNAIEVIFRSDLRICHSIRAGLEESSAMIDENIFHVANKNNFTMNSLSCDNKNWKMQLNCLVILEVVLHVWYNMFEIHLLSPSTYAIECKNVSTCVQIRYNTLF